MAVILTTYKSWDDPLLQVQFGLEALLQLVPFFAGDGLFGSNLLFWLRGEGVDLNHIWSNHERNYMVILKGSC